MRLVEITKDNWEEVVEMTSNKDGIPTLYEGFVTGNAYSILQAFFEEGWETRAIEEEGKLVGFTMFGKGPDDFPEICRLLIDRKYQNRGLGRRALSLITEEMKKDTSFKEIYISAEPENERGLHLYRSFGFKDTGKMVEGEVLLVMKI